ncbi:MAG: ABC transporter permease subunit [Desulfobacterales bacterium]|nr:ABC transporter permease subunit [Desulfobacterales bacterium]
MRFQLNPLTVKKFRRFKSIRRGYYALIILVAMVVLCLGAELLVNSRALVVSFDGRLYWPTYGNPIPGTVFGLDYQHETNYRELAARFAEQNMGNWLLMPPVPYNPFENDFRENTLPPTAPSLAERHFCGTDASGRDVLARLVYGFRVAIFFSLALLIATYGTGIGIGCAMGYFGGAFDLFFQRLIEIWSSVPNLYVIIIIASVVIPNFWILLLILWIFGWMGITWTMRTVTYKERARDYVLAARALGASHGRIIVRHILPNTVSVIVSYIPFQVAGGIVTLSALDFLGFGLPPPEPSWGELLQQGWANLSAWWLSGSVVAAMVLTLVLVTFVGEAVREALDPKMHTTYE